MKRRLLTSIIIGSIFFASVNITSLPVRAAVEEDSIVSVSEFPDVPKSYWGYYEIMGAVEKGYVDGLPDGTFAPDRDVSRAEFIKMVVAAMNIPVAKQNPGEPWYLPYTTAARQYGLIENNEYQDNNFEATMSRMEMAKVSVRAVNKSADRDEQFMLVATENGLIMGTGNGNLNPYGTTTRAQSVTIVERVLKVRAGETLPVDEKAVENAKDFADQELDPWGREIRTYDLPKNADDFPYILKDIPNEMYEMPYHLGDRRPEDIVTAKEVYQDSLYRTESVSTLVKNVEEFYNHILNVDYRTIDYSWAEKAVDLLSSSNSKDKLLREAKSYVDWVKENNLVMEGSLKAEPSMLHRTFSGATIRSYLEFKIESGKVEDRSVLVFYSAGNSFFYENLGSLRKMYVDIFVSPSANSMGRLDWSWYKPSTKSHPLHNHVELG